MPRMMQLWSLVRENSATGMARKLSNTMLQPMAMPVLLPSLRPVSTPPMPSRSSTQPICFLMRARSVVHACPKMRGAINSTMNQMSLS